MPTMTKKHRIRLVDPQGGRSPTAAPAGRRACAEAADGEEEVRRVTFGLRFA
jgi:hypothetical protein